MDHYSLFVAWLESKGSNREEFEVELIRQKSTVEGFRNKLKHDYKTPWKRLWDYPTDFFSFSDSVKGKSYWLSIFTLDHQEILTVEKVLGSINPDNKVPITVKNDENIKELFSHNYVIRYHKKLKLLEFDDSDISQFFSIEDIKLKKLSITGPNYAITLHDTNDNSNTRFNLLIKDKKDTELIRNFLFDIFLSLKQENCLL